MSTEIPGLPESELNGDDEAVFDDLARRAGEALRRPAPADGVRVIAARRRREQALKTSVLGGVAVATLIGALVIIANRNDADSLPPVDSSPATLPATTIAAPTPTALVPVDSSPATLPPTTSPTPTGTASVPVDSLLVTIPTPPAVVQPLWVELEPGAIAPLPPAPLPPEFMFRDLVWTGTEFIVWGGLADIPGQPPSQALAAAFDPAAGTWRQIAQPPDGVGWTAAVWSGTEMLVWSDGSSDTSSAAYDPASDTWRTIANSPVPGFETLWIGDAAVLLGDPTGGGSGFAYVPATDEWRRLADGSWDPFSAVWTGTTIIVTTDMDSDGNGAGYDPATDTWRVLEGLDEGGKSVVIPGRDGAAATVAFLPDTWSTPVELLDDRGNSIGKLAGRPAELAESAGTCDRFPGDTLCLFAATRRAVSVGGEVLFWVDEDGWAFEPETQTWRSFELDGRQPGLDGTEVVAAGDVLFAWGADGGGLVYRAAAPG
jgi:hypothetical protein